MSTRVRPLGISLAQHPRGRRHRRVCRLLSTPALVRSAGPGSSSSRRRRLPRRSRRPVSRKPVLLRRRSVHSRYRRAAGSSRRLRSRSSVRPCCERRPCGRHGAMAVLPYSSHSPGVLLSQPSGDRLPCFGRRRLTPACSGLATLAADARRWAAWATFGCSSSVPRLTYHRGQTCVPSARSCSSSSPAGPLCCPAVLPAHSRPVHPRPSSSSSHAPTSCPRPILRWPSPSRCAGSSQSRPAMPAPPVTPA